MNKILRFSLLALLAVVGWNNAMADDVTINFDNDYATLFPNIGQSSGTGASYNAAGEFNETTTSTAVQGVTVTISPSAADAGTRNRMWSSSPRLRMYDGTIIIKASQKFKKLTMNIKTNNGLVAKNNTVNTGTLNFDELTSATGKIIWEGDANEVTMTIAGNTQFKSIVVSFDGGSTGPTEGQTAETAITASRALELIKAMADGATSDAQYYVKGVVTSLGTINSSGATFFFADNATSTTTLQAYKLKGLGNAAITNTKFLSVGDAVVVYGSLQKYKNNTSGEITPEVSGGYVYSVNGKTTDDTPNPEDAITNGTKENPMTAAEAIAYINGFTDSFTTEKQYYVKGSVSEVTEISTSNGNATFKMGDLVAFRLRGLENKSITTEDYVKANDEVIVLAKLQKYVKEGTVTPELSGGYIYSLNGKTSDSEPYTPVGNGTKENPYTATDLVKMAVPESTSAADGQEKVWVKGFIAGSLNSAGTALLEGEDIAASNIGIADAAGETDGKNCAPIQLTTGTIRDGLNVKDNSGNVGKEVMVYGYLLKYMNRAGIKNVAAYVLDGKEVSSVSSITIDINANAPAYNLAGQRVNQGYKGLVIKGGRKLIQK